MAQLNLLKLSNGRNKKQATTVRWGRSVYWHQTARWMIAVCLPGNVNTWRYGNVGVR